MKGKKYVFVDEPEIPYSVQPGTVYVNRGDCYASLDCPCGCGNLITIPTLDDTDFHPNWKISGNTITPSINMTSGCKSHFSITNGIVE